MEKQFPLVGKFGKSIERNDEKAAKLRNNRIAMWI